MVRNAKERAQLDDRRHTRIESGRHCDRHVQSSLHSATPSATTVGLELRRIAVELENDSDVKVVVFTGAGDAAFSAGADIKDFESYRNNSTMAKVYSEAFDGAMDAIEAISKPTISLIRGFCVGGGCELSTATDIRIAADNSRFGIPVARLGILGRIQ